MVDKGPDTNNPLAIVGSGFLGGIAMWFWAKLMGKRPRGPVTPVNIDLEGIRADMGTLRSEFRTLKADLAADVGEISERMDRLQGSLARIIRDGSHGD